MQAFTRAAALAAALTVVAGAAGPGARVLLDQAKALDDGPRHWTDRTQRMKLTLVDAHGGERVRELTVSTKRFPADEDKSISTFLAPAEVKGTGFLQWGHQSGDDDQWLYLPAYGRTRRITAQMRDESFVGTDFSYRDLDILGDFQNWTEHDAPSALLGEEAVDGSACHVIELRPQQEGMTYGRIVLWLDRDKLTARRMEFYDREGEKLKRLALQEITDVGKVPTAHTLEMQSLKKGTRTRVDVADVQYDSSIPDDHFTQRQLERGGAP